MDVNKKQLADIFSVTERTLTDWEGKGMPIKLRSGRGVANVYDTADVINWRIQFHLSGENKATARERLDLASAKLRELELAEKSGRYLLAEEVEQVMEGAIVAARTVFNSGARKLKKKIKKLYGIDVELGIIQERDRRTLTKLARYKADSEDDGGEDLEAMAATGTD